MRTQHLGTSTLGVWTRQEALAVTTRGVVQSCLRRGEWQVLLPGVYADGGFEPSHVQWAFAAVLACGGPEGPMPFGEGRRRVPAVVAGRDAARLWGLPLVDDDDPATGARELALHDVHVWAAGPPLAASRPDGTVHRVTRHRLVLRDGDLVRLKSGLWVASPLRTVVDCAGLLSLKGAVCAADDALHRRLISAADLAAAAASRAGRPGARTLRRVVAAADGRAESPTETLARLLLLPHLPGLVPQVRLWDKRGRLLARFDLADERLLLAVELDGRRAHAGEAMRARDTSRDRTTAGRGYLTERGTWFDVRCRPGAFVGRVRTAAVARES